MIAEGHGCSPASPLALEELVTLPSFKRCSVPQPFNLCLIATFSSKTSSRNLKDKLVAPTKLLLALLLSARRCSKMPATRSSDKHLHVLSPSAQQQMDISFAKHPSLNSAPAISGKYLIVSYYSITPMNHTYSPPPNSQQPSDAIWYALRNGPKNNNFPFSNTGDPTRPIYLLSTTHCHKSISTPTIDKDLGWMACTRRIPDRLWSLCSYCSRL